MKIKLVGTKKGQDRRLAILYQSHFLLIACKTGQIDVAHVVKHVMPYFLTMVVIFGNSGRHPKKTQC